MNCPQCFRGDYWEPPWQCGECEARQIEREDAYAHEQHQDDLTSAFHDMCDALDADRAKLIALGADPGPTMSEVFGHASDMSEEWLTNGPQAGKVAHNEAGPPEEQSEGDE